MTDVAPFLPVGERVVVAETGGGRFQVQARAPSAAFLIDEPVSAGGLGSGPNPYDLLSAALGACTTMTIRLYADRKAWPLEHVQVCVQHHRATLKSRDLFDRAITLKGPLDEAQRARLLEIAEKCPVHLTLTQGSEVQTSLTAVWSDPPPPVEGVSEHMRDMDEACAG